MDKTTLLGLWTSQVVSGTTRRDSAFVFSDDSFDATGKLVSWSGSAVTYLHNDSGFCYDAVLTMRHRCDLTREVDGSTVEMIDREESCTAVNNPVSGQCSGTIRFACGVGTQDNTFQVRYDEATAALSVVQVSAAGRGGEYDGTYLRTVKTAGDRLVALTGVGPDHIAALVHAAAT